MDRIRRSNAATAASLAAGCLLILLVVSNRVSRSIFERLEFIVGKMKALARGEEEFAREIATSAKILRNEPRTSRPRDEIDVLVSGFLEMVTQIQNRDRELAAAANSSKSRLRCARRSCAPPTHN